MATANTDTKVVTGRTRFSFVNVFQPRAMNPGDPEKYSLCVLIPKSDKATLAKINKAIEAVKAAGIATWGGKIPPNLKLPLRDGDAERPDSEGFPGHYFLNANSKQRPGVVDANLNPILDSTEVYSGCYGRVSVNFYAFNSNGNRGIACGLNNVQKLADGEYLGGRSRAEDDFADDYQDDYDF